MISYWIFGKYETQWIYSAHRPSGYGVLTVLPQVIDFSHGLAIYERCPRAVEPLWVEVRLLHCMHCTAHYACAVRMITIYRPLAAKLTRSTME